MRQAKRVGLLERSTLSEECKAEVVAAFLASGKTVADLASDYGVAEATLRQWVREASDEALCARPAAPDARATNSDWGSPARNAAADVPSATVSKSNGTAHGTEAAADFEPEIVEYEFEDATATVASVMPAPLAAARPRITKTQPKQAGTRAKVDADAAKSASALARAKRKAAEAEARAKAAAEAAAAARAETTAARTEAATARAETSAAYAAGVEAILRAEVAAAAAVAEAERAARTSAEAAARDEIAAAESAAEERIATVYAEAVEAMLRVEVSAAEKVVQEEAVRFEVVAQLEQRLAEAEAAAADAVSRCESLAEAVPRSEAVVAEARAAANSEAAARMTAEEQRAEIAAEPNRTYATVEPAAPVQVTPVVRPRTPPTEAMAPEMAPLEAGTSGLPAHESSAWAEIAQLVARLSPIGDWVQATGRTEAEAREAALAQLGVDEADAEIEVLAKAFRWLPGRVHIRARVRAGGDTRLPHPAPGRNASF